MRPAVPEHAEKSMGGRPRLASEPRYSLMWPSEYTTPLCTPPQVGTSGAELLHLPAAPHRPRQGHRVQPPCQANPTYDLHTYALVT